MLVRPEGRGARRRSGRGDASCRALPGDDTPPLAASDFVPATRRACRATSLKGGATVQASGHDERARPLAQGDLLPEGGPPRAARRHPASLQATVSTREIAVSRSGGSGRLPRGEEAVRVSFGREFSGSRAWACALGPMYGLRLRLGVVRFNDAQIESSLRVRCADPRCQAPGGQSDLLARARRSSARSRGDAGRARRAHYPQRRQVFRRATDSTPSRLLLELVGACRTEAEAAREAARSGPRARAQPRPRTARAARFCARASEAASEGRVRGRPSCWGLETARSATVNARRPILVGAPPRSGRAPSSAPLDTLPTRR